MTRLADLLDDIAADAPYERASWDDVRSRARRPNRIRAAGLVVAAALATILVATPAFGIGDRIGGLFGGDRIASDDLSREELHIIGAMASGASPRLEATAGMDLSRFEAASLRRIAVREGRAFFIANAVGGGTCVSIQNVKSERLLGSILCTPEFPSAARPILDQSIFHGSPSSPKLIALEGFADDTIASVAVLTDTGAVVAPTEVKDNVYRRSDGLPRDTTSAIIALDEGGAELYRLCFARGCRE